MHHKTKGIVLHTIKYSETSVISKIYTEKFGLLSFIVKGVRSSRSKNKASLLQPLTLLDMELQYRENRNLQFIKEFSRDYTYVSLPFDTLKSAIALFLLEVITKSIHEHEPNTELFGFVNESLIELDKQKKLNPDFHLLFLVHFTRYLGFFPNENYSSRYPNFEMQEGVFIEPGKSKPVVLDTAESKLLYELITTPLYQTPKNKITRAERKNLLTKLVIYYKLHLENFSLKSPEILEELID